MHLKGWIKVKCWCDSLYRSHFANLDLFGLFVFLKQAPVKAIYIWHRNKKVYKYEVLVWKGAKRSEAYDIHPHWIFVTGALFNNIYIINPTNNMFNL